MKVEVSMTKDETKFTSERWWASTPAFVLFTLDRQLVAAAAIWPELANWRVSAHPDLDPTRPTTSAPVARPEPEDECSPQTNSPDTSRITTARANAVPTATTAQMSGAVSTVASASDGVAETANTGIPSKPAPGTSYGEKYPVAKAE